MRAGSGDMTVKSWSGGQVQKTFQGHSDSVRSLCELPGIGFVSASHDMTLRIWAITGEVIAELVGHTALVLACAASSSGMIVSGVLCALCCAWFVGCIPGCILYAAVIQQMLMFLGIAAWSAWCFMRNRGAARALCHTTPL